MSAGSHLKKCLCIALSLLVLLKTIPVEAKAYKADKVGNGEKAAGIAKQFFDGSGLDPIASIKTAPHYPGQSVPRRGGIHLRVISRGYRWDVLGRTLYAGSHH